MAKPRVFISSTFYDLKHVREDVEIFVNTMGYEAIRHETGSIPYGSEERIEKYAYKELETCDIVVSIIGGRYGTESTADEQYSISQIELKKALEKGIQVFIFIDSNVLTEYHTYKENKDKKDVKYHYIDDVKIYKFIEYIYGLPRNNPITKFDTSVEIITYLKLQWAGIFQRFLDDQKKAQEIKVIEEIKAVAGTLQQLVSFLTEEKRSSSDAIKSILTLNHPAFRRLSDIVKNKYRVCFLNRTELNNWLKAKNFSPVDKDRYDEDSKYEWTHSKDDMYIKITEEIFEENGNLKIYSVCSDGICPTPGRLG
jgi:hypothetical protein